MASKITAHGKVIEAGNDDAGLPSATIEVGGRLCRFAVTEDDARAFARHLYGVVRVTVECVGEAAVEMPTEARVPFTIDRRTADGWTRVDACRGTEADAIDLVQRLERGGLFLTGTTVRCVMNGRRTIYLHVRAKGDVSVIAAAEAGE